MAIESARLLDDRYALEDVIGRGGMADVYRATDRVLERPVAVKLLRETTASESDRARFTGEARTLARLNHAGLVAVLDAGTSADQPYLVMELVDGSTLAEHCAGQAMDPVHVARVGVQLAEALAYAHAEGVVHRDVKPSNVLLHHDGRASLTDFGIARLMADTTRHTRTGLTIGSPAYLSPEQVRGGEVTPAADVYSLGLVLLEALTGERAYTGAPVEAALARLTHPPPIPADLPDGWRRLLAHMTALEPGERPTADEAAAHLRALVTAGATPPRAVPKAEEPPPTVPAADASTSTQGLSLSRRSMPVRLLAAAGAAVLLVIFAATLLGDRGSQGAGRGDQIPRDVPARFEEPLAELHDAVRGDGR